MTHDVQILYAVESGSRAWGMASADSDHDVRFVYARPRDALLSLDPPRDTIEVTHAAGTLDCAGWDLAKALRLFRSGNNQAHEWLHSPIVYRDDFGLMGQLRGIEADWFSPKSSIHHHLALAAGNYRRYIEAPRERALESGAPITVLTKKYLYVLRSLLSAAWVARYGTMAPVPIDDLLPLIADRSVKRAVAALIATKRAGGELGLGPVLPTLDTYIVREQERLDAVATAMVSPPRVGDDTLDRLYREMLSQAWAQASSP